MKTHELAACPGCGAVHARPFAYGSVSLQRCGRCDLVFAREHADPAELYVTGYLRGETDFGLDLTAPRFQEYLRHAATERLRRIERVAPPPGAFLDVGCGGGEVLAVARDRGWAPAGAEPVDDSARMAQERGLDVRAALLEDAGFPEGSFDVVAAFHVLEHMTDGAGFLCMMARWAKPGGVVAVEVPNWRSFHRRGFGARWPGLRPLEHVAHYTPATLAATMRHAGLEPIRVFTPSFLWAQHEVGQQITDLGLHRHRRMLGAAPAPVARPLLHAVQSVYNVTKTGMVALAVARVAPG